MSGLDISCLALDLGNVLIRVDHLRFCRGLAAYTNPSLTPEEVYTAIFDSGLEPGFDTGRLSSPEFYRRIMALFGLSLPYSQFCTLWNEIFDPMEGMEEILNHLKGHYPLFMVSNTNPLHFQYLQERFPALWAHFRGLILSFQVGCRKPEAAFYQALLREAAVPPSRCLFIDDKPEFIQAARRHGLLAWQFVSPQSFRQDLQENGLW